MLWTRIGGVDTCGVLSNSSISQSLRKKSRSLCTNCHSLFQTIPSYYTKARFTPNACVASDRRASKWPHCAIMHITWDASTCLVWTVTISNISLICCVETCPCTLQNTGLTHRAETECPIIDINTIKWHAIFFRLYIFATTVAYILNTYSSNVIMWLAYHKWLFKI